MRRSQVRLLSAPPPLPSLPRKTAVIPALPLQSSAAVDLIWIFLAALAGVCIAIQAAANGSLRGNLGDPRMAAFFSICGTFISAILMMLVCHPKWPSAMAFRAAPWWNWIGGPLGAAIVLAGAA